MWLIKNNSSSCWAYCTPNNVNFAKLEIQCWCDINEYEHYIIYRVQCVLENVALREISSWQIFKAVCTKECTNTLYFWKQCGTRRYHHPINWERCVLENVVHCNNLTQWTRKNGWQRTYTVWYSIFWLPSCCSVTNLFNSWLSWWKYILFVTFRCADPSMLKMHYQIMITRRVH